ncbi:MAG: endonuclease/exonuclease/phosphatase family protein [Pseudomonadota bacterium]
MKILSYNIQYGRGMDGDFDLVRTCKRLRGADIICLQEVEQGWERSGNIDQAAEITGLLPTYYSVYGASFDVDASVRSAHGAVINKRRRQGNLTLSRWPIVSSRTFNLPKVHFPDKFNMQMGFIESVIVTPDGPVRVYNYHAGYLESAERVIQVKAFSKVYHRSVQEQGAWSGKADIDGYDWSNGRELPAMPVSAIVCGDFNANHQTEEYRVLLEQTGLQDCWALIAPAEVNVKTWKGEETGDIQVSGKIDHILVSPDLTVGLKSARVDQDCDASDHTPIEVEIDLPV